jgi:surface protein
MSATGLATSPGTAVLPTCSIAIAPLRAKARSSPRRHRSQPFLSGDRHGEGVAGMELEDAPQRTSVRGARWRIVVVCLLCALLGAGVGAGYALWPREASAGAALTTPAPAPTPAPTTPAPTPAPTTPAPTTLQDGTVLPNSTVLTDAGEVCQSKFAMRWPSKSFLPACGVDPSLQPFVTYEELEAAVISYCDSDPAYEGKYGAMSMYGDIRAWNVSSVTVFASLFLRPYGAAGCDADISRWHTSQVTNLNSMFGGNKGFNSDISGWDVSNVYTMESTFQGATAFDKPLAKWNTTSVQSMRRLFASSNFNQDIGSWNVGRVAWFWSMFENNPRFNKNLSGWDTSGATVLSGMFAGATAFNGDISTWRVSKVESIGRMFQNAAAFDGNLGSWDVSGVTARGGFNGMFWNATAFSGSNIGSWTFSAAPKSMAFMFKGASKFNASIGSWNMTSVTDTTSMLEGAVAFNQDLNGWNTSSITAMKRMFIGSTAFNQKLCWSCLAGDANTVGSNTDYLFINSSGSWETAALCTKWTVPCPPI